MNFAKFLMSIYLYFSNACVSNCIRYFCFNESSKELPRLYMLNLEVDQSVTRFSSVRVTNISHTCPKIRSDPWNFEFKTKLDQF